MRIGAKARSELKRKYPVIYGIKRDDGTTDLVFVTRVASSVSGRRTDVLTAANTRGRYKQLKTPTQGRYDIRTDLILQATRLQPEDVWGYVADVMNAAADKGVSPYVYAGLDERPSRYKPRPPRETRALRMRRERMGLSVEEFYEDPVRFRGVK